MTVVSVELTPRNPAPFGTSPLLQAFRWVCWTIAYTYHPFHRELDSAGGKAESRRLHWRVQRRSCFL